MLFWCGRIICYILCNNLALVAWEEARRGILPLNEVTLLLIADGAYHCPETVTVGF